eukprot:2084_1
MTQHKANYFQYSQCDNTSDPLSPSDATDNTNASKWYCNPSNWLRIIIISMLLALIIVAIVNHQISAKLLTSFLTWMKENVIEGSAAFVAVYTCCVVLMIPGSILTLGAGFVYVDLLGPLIGVCTSTVIVWISASMGATLSFINGRYLLRNCVVSWASQYDKFEIIEKIVKEYGFSVTFWLRLSGITPYNVFNYFMGLTSVTLMDYVLAHTGMIPNVVLGCFIGGSVSELVSIAETGVGDNQVFMIVLISTLAISIVGMITISCFAKKKFDRMVQEVKEQEAKQQCKYNDYDSFDGVESVISFDDRIMADRMSRTSSRTHSKSYQTITV